MSLELSTVVRFAPSPNGYLHLGHAFSALKNAELAHRTGGSMLLRIEDIDLGRSRKAFEDAIFEDVAWLGISWAEPVRRQSSHFSDYAAALTNLERLGCCYPCFCSRGDIRAATRDPTRPRDPDGEALYPGTCKRLSAREVAERVALGRPSARRLDMDRAVALCPSELDWQEFGEGERARTVIAQPRLWGDAVIARKDVPASYMLAVVVDDALQGITDVVRGEDLDAATSLQRLLAALLDLPVPRFRHHRLVRDADGVKLSKSIASTALRSIRATGTTAADLRRSLGFA